MKNKAFSLMELLIVVTILSIVIVGVISYLNPVTIIQRGNDTARKKSLDDAKKILEEYMADTGCYPQPTQVCADSDGASVTCHICTKNQGTKFSYFTKDICDPNNTTFGFLYQPETVVRPKDYVNNIPAGFNVASCPKWFRIYSVLDSPYNAAEDIWGCKKGGCGVAPNYGYSYLITSPGAPTEGVMTNNWYCHKSIDNKCRMCAPYENCISPSYPCYGETLYPSCRSCCEDGHPESCSAC